jgi:GNAT superfamily N-acetyltransferase
VKKYFNYPEFVNFLYKDEIRRVEEIYIIENLYLSPKIHIFVDKDKDDMIRFMLVQKDNEGGCFAFIEANGNENFIKKSVEILNTQKSVQVQCSESDKILIAKHIQFLTEFEYMIMKFEPDKFKPVHGPEPTRITTAISFEELVEISGQHPERYREQIRHGILYGFKEKNRWISLGGSFVHSKNYNYIFIETSPKYRGRGLAKATLSRSIEETLKEGKMPVYALDASNKPSLNLALKMGFTPYIKLRCGFVLTHLLHSYPALLNFLGLNRSWIE